MNKQFRYITEFEESDYGKTLKKSIRFEKFKPEQTTNDEWVRILGADVQNFFHMKLMQNLCKSFSKYDKKLSNKDRETLSLVASVHDWAEAIIGDIPAPYKTSSDIEIEKKHLKKLLKDYQVQNRTRILSVLFNELDPLHKVFNLYEKLGYFRTALNAWEKAKKTDDKELSENLKKLTRSVFFKQMTNFLELFNYSDLIKALFDTKHKEIEDIINDFSKLTDLDSLESQNIIIIQEKWRQIRANEKNDNRKDMT